MYKADHNKHLLPLAKKLRKNLTPTEYKLWQALRAGRLGGLKFRRQYAIGPYVVDFCCPAKRIVIEIDGLYHDMTIAEDAQRQHYIEQHGLHGLAFSKYGY